MKVIALINVKGGVGKTTSAVNLAFLSARAGARSLLWDLDPQGSATFILRIEPRVAGGGGRILTGQIELGEAIRGSDFEGLDVLPADFRYHKWAVVLAREADAGAVRRRLAFLRGEYDHVWLDCPPGLSPVAECVFEAADALAIPTVPSPLALRTLAQLMKHLKSRERRPHLLPFFSLVDRRKALQRSVCDRVQDLALGFLRTEIPSSSLVEQMTSRRAPLFLFAPHSAAALAYEGLWREIQERLAGQGSGALTNKERRAALEDVARRPLGRAHAP